MAKPFRDNIFVEEPDGLVLLGSVCRQCGTRTFPARDNCLWCTGLAPMVPARFSGKGTLYAFTRVHLPSAKVAETPYLMAMVALDDGPTVPALLVRKDGEDYRVGERLQAVVRPLRQDQGEDVLGYWFTTDTG